MLLYNSLTRQKDEFKTREPGKVKMYTCGPTVYHFAHIGNLRTYMMEDVLEKYLTYAGYQVMRIMNITDVGHLTSDGDTGDDKMLKGAKREHKTVMEIAKFYTDAFFADCDKLNIKKPEYIQPATGCIPEYIHMIETLLQKGYAYEAGGNIYFDTSKLDQYYRFHDFKEEDLEVGVREGVEGDANKRNKADFVLWFTKSKFDDQELKWESPWGLGYPGWHIECSCISMKFAGEYLDLHCGGIDNAFPHHTNEIAQSEAYLGHEWCPQWFHVLHLNDETGKMSKSKGEFLTVSLLMDRGFNPLDYRFFAIGSHYRNYLNFTWEALEGAKEGLKSLHKKTDPLIGKATAITSEAAKAFQQEFKDAIGDDLNMPRALGIMNTMLKSDIDDGEKAALVADFDQIFGLKLDEPREEYAKKGANDGVDVAKIEALIAARKEARANKNWAESDRIRDELAAMNVVIKDSKEGTTWEIKA